jgi:hypothetical protein
MVLFRCGFSTYAELLALLIRTFFVCLLDGKYYNLSIQLEGLFFHNSYLVQCVFLQVVKLQVISDVQIMYI